MEADSKGKGDAFVGMPTRLCWPRRCRTRARATVPTETKPPPRYSPGQAKHLLLIPKRTVSSGAPPWDDGEDLQSGGRSGSGQGFSLALGVTRPQRRAQEDEALLILLRFSAHDCYRVNRRQWEGFLLALLTVTFAHHFFPCPSEAVLKEKHIQKNRDGQRKLYKIPLPAPH